MIEERGIRKLPRNNVHCLCVNCKSNYDCNCALRDVELNGKGECISKEV